MIPFALSCSLFLISLSVNAVVIDGNNITGDFANASWKTYQDTFTDWGDNKIQALYVMPNDTHLLFGIPGYVDNNSVVVLLDVNPETGSNAIPAGLTQPERVKGMAGMRFDQSFTPDQAVSLGINGGRTEGWPHLENIVGDSTRYLNRQHLVLQHYYCWASFAGDNEPYIALLTNTGGHLPPVFSFNQNIAS